MIFARSPFIITIDETPQESTRLELFLWNGTGAAPAAPTYSLSKKVPSVNNNATYYNIAPFIREFFDFTQSSPVASGVTANTNDYAYCNVIYKTYYTLDGTETLIDTVTDKAFDGFGYFENEYNYQGKNVLLTELDAYYYDCDNASAIVTIYTEATIVNNWIARYTHETIAMGFSITEEAVEDNLYDSLSSRYTKALARGMAYTKQVKAAFVLNNAFSGGPTYGDGVVLCSTAHPLVSGGTNSNTPATPSDLNETSLENAVIQIAAWTDERGLLIAAKPKAPNERAATALINESAGAIVASVN